MGLAKGYGEGALVAGAGGGTDRRERRDTELYRYGAHAAEFWANVTVGPGTNHVRLKFAERRTDNDDPSLRAVTVLINGQIAVEDLDISATAGGVHRAVDLVFNGIEPRRGIIEVRLRNAYGGEAALRPWK